MNQPSPMCGDYYINNGFRGLYPRAPVFRVSPVGENCQNGDSGRASEASVRDDNVIEGQCECSSEEYVPLESYPLTFLVTKDMFAFSSIIFSRWRS